MGYFEAYSPSLFMYLEAMAFDSNEWECRGCYEIALPQSPEPSPGYQKYLEERAQIYQGQLGLKLPEYQKIFLKNVGDSQIEYFPDCRFEEEDQIKLCRLSGSEECSSFSYGIFVRELEDGDLLRDEEKTMICLLNALYRVWPK